MVTPVFTHKDGEASPFGYSGSAKEITVDDNDAKVVAWITFQTGDIDFASVKKSTLLLHVKSIDDFRHP